MKRTILFLIALCGCGCSNWREHRQILNQAESVIELQADSAYNILSSIRFEDIKNRENQARYALLYTKAQDKMRIDIKSDSLISIALEYYQEYGHGSRFYKASAYYYSAEVDRHKGDIIEAVRKLAYAKEIVPQDSLYLRGLIYGAIGRCHEAQSNHLGALENYSEVYEIFHRLKIRDNEASSLYNQAKQYGFLHYYSMAIRMCLEAKDIYSELRDTTNMLKCDMEIIKYRIRTEEDIVSVRHDFFKQRELYTNHLKEEVESSLLSDLYSFDMVDSSAYYQQKMLSSLDTTTRKQKVTYHTRYALLSNVKSDYKAAYSHLLKANIDIRHLYEENLNNSVDKLSEKYKGELHKSRAKRLKSERNAIWTICIILLCLSGAIIFILVKHYKSRLRKADEDLGAAQDLAQAIVDTQASIETVSNDSLDPERLDNINYMMSRFNTLIENMPSYESKPRKFVDEFITIMRSQNQDEDAKTIFYEIINRNYPDVLTAIETKYNLSIAEVEVLSMLALGISNNAIRILMNHTNNKTIYNIRSTIKSKLKINLDSKSILGWLDAHRQA